MDLAPPRNRQVLPGPASARASHPHFIQNEKRYSAEALQAMR
jgi:hypothetical protein